MCFASIASPSSSRLCSRTVCQRLGGCWASSGGKRGRARGRERERRRGFAGCPVATPGGGARGAHDLCPLVHNRRVLPKDGLRRFCAQRSEPCTELRPPGRGAEGVAARTWMAASCFMKTSWFAA